MTRHLLSGTSDPVHQSFHLTKLTG